MSDALLLLPDLALIITGYLLCRNTPIDRRVWDGTEQLVYFVLFPALLFSSIVRHPLTLGAALPLGASALAIVCTGVVLAYALRALPGVDRRLHASGAQTAFRFNSFVGLALADRLVGSSGVASMALLVAVCVPICNVAAVWPLARAGGHGYGGQLLRNPLILATAAGLAFNIAGLELPELVATTLSRVGAAALPLGLMAVGAGLQLGALREGPKLAATLLTIRHVLLPMLALALTLGPGAAIALPAAQQIVVVAFSALPTASSAYVLAVRMGGHGGYAAGLVTVSTVLGMVALPLWLGAWRSLSG